MNSARPSNPSSPPLTSTRSTAISGPNALSRTWRIRRPAGAQVVIDLTNSPSVEDSAVLEFFETSGRNFLREAAAGVQDYVAL
jgi:hypothetical protein